MILEKEIDWETDFGDVIICLKKIMDKKKININKMSRLSKVKYDIVKKYYYGDCYAFNREILAKFCYILECNIADLLIYLPSRTTEKKDYFYTCKL